MASDAATSDDEEEKQVAKSNIESDTESVTDSEDYQESDGKSVADSEYEESDEERDKEKKDRCSLHPISNHFNKKNKKKSVLLRGSYFDKTSKVNPSFESYMEYGNKKNQYWRSQGGNAEIIIYCASFEEARDAAVKELELKARGDVWSIMVGKSGGNNKLSSLPPNQAIGIKSQSQQVLRTDFDPEKGPHFNVINSDGRKMAFLYNGTEYAHRAVVGRLTYGTDIAKQRYSDTRALEELKADDILQRLQSMK